MPNTVITKHSTRVFSVNNGTFQKIDGSPGATTEGNLIHIKGRNGQILYQDVIVGGGGDRLLIEDLTTASSYDPATSLEAMSILESIGFLTEAALVGAGTFAGLLDTSIVAPANIQVPIYNAGIARWQNETLTTAHLSDFNVTAPVQNSVLQWDGNDWVNRFDLFLGFNQEIQFGTQANLFHEVGGVNLDLDQAGMEFRIRNNADIELLYLQHDNGNMFLPVGSMFINSGGLSVSSSIVANGVSAINNNLLVDGNLDVTGDLTMDDGFGILWSPSGNYIINTAGVLYLFSTDDVIIEAQDDIILSASANVIIDSEFVANNNSFFLSNIQCSGKIRVADSVAAPVAGDIRYNNGAGRHEGYNGVSWQAMY